MCLYRSSYTAMQDHIHNFGRSETNDAMFHRVCGYIFIYGFLVMSDLGGIRCVADLPRHVRMTLHSVFGFVLYVLGLVLIITSQSIPSSPTLAACDSGTGLPIPDELYFTSWMVVAWIIAEVIFHALMTALQCYLDRAYRIRRTGFGLPFVPSLPPAHLDDFVGSRLRKFLLGVYVLVSFGITSAVLINLFNKEHEDRHFENCTLGPMDCDLSEIRPNQTSSHFGCASLTLRYYALVCEEYNISGLDVVR